MRFVFKSLIGMVVIGFLLAACAVPFAPRLVRGSGNIVSEPRSVSGFDEILVTGVGTVIITQGDQESLTIETDDNLLKYIETTVKGSTLEIGFTRDTVFGPGNGRKALEPTDGFVFRISVVDLNSVTLSGAARIEVGKLKTDSLELSLSGAGDILVEDLNADLFNVVVSGAGDVQVDGKVGSQDIRLSGLGRYQAADLESGTAEVNISGAGGAEVWVMDELVVLISGAGDVTYYGSPSISPTISGLGRIQGLGDK